MTHASMIRTWYLVEGREKENEMRRLASCEPDLVEARTVHATGSGNNIYWREGLGFINSRVGTLLYRKDSAKGKRAADEIAQVLAHLFGGYCVVCDHLVREDSDCPGWPANERKEMIR